MGGNSERLVRKEEKEARERAKYYKENPDKAPKPDEKFIKQLERDNRGNNGDR